MNCNILFSTFMCFSIAILNHFMMNLVRGSSGASQMIHRINVMVDRSVNKQVMVMLWLL